MNDTPTARDPNPVAPARRGARLLLLLLTFACGGVVGAAVGAAAMRERMLAMMRHPEHVPDRVLPRLRSGLSLTDDQARAVEEIVRRRHAAMEAIRADAFPHQTAEFTAMCDEVAGVLDGGQRQKWSDLCREMRERYLPVAPAGGLGPPPADLLFRRFDANADGALTEDEVPPRMWQRLRAADANGDGKVTRQEYLDARSRGAGEPP